MTSTAAVIGLTYSGADIQVITGIFLEITKGLAEGPQVRGVDIVVPGRDGRLARPRRADTTRIELHGWVRGVGTTEATDRHAFADNRASFNALFNPAANPANLVAYLENGDVATISARTLPTILFENRVPSYAEVNVELEGLGTWQVTLGGS